MFNDEYSAMSNGAVAKSNLLKNNPVGYFVSSILCGAFIGIGMMLMFTISGLNPGAPYLKVIMGASFAIALSLVVIAGGELFTGNNMVMTAGVLEKKITGMDLVKVWVVCYIGNWIGSIIMALIYTGTGLGDGDIMQAMANGAAAKMTVPFLPLLLRGVMCNFLVCLAVWCGFRTKSESGKLIMIFWCIFAFVTTGFEHSIANMTILTIGLLNPLNDAISVTGYFYNLGVVTLGNIIGGALLVAIPYFIISRKKNAE